jgi:hypothetical protein
MNIHDAYRPFQRYFRTKRMRLFARLFGLSDRSKIIDVGGTRFNWELIDERPDVTMINIVGEEWIDGRFRMVNYDGKKLPFADRTFDICYSNSVIEHVGDWNKVVKFAEELQRMAPAYYVQTPNRDFFVEPHFIGILIHWFPFKLFRKLVRYLSIWGWMIKPTQDQVDEAIRDINLLTEKEMELLFPGAKIIRETFLGMTKSIIATRISDV